MPAGKGCLGPNDQRCPRGRRTSEVESALAPVPNGAYMITRPGEQMLTMEGGSSEPKTPVVLLPPTGNPGEQEWQMEELSNGNCTIRNLRSGTYLAFDGDPEMNKPVVGFPEPREWALYQSAQPLRGHEVSGQASNRVVLNKETRKKWRHPVNTRRSSARKLSRSR